MLRVEGGNKRVGKNISVKGGGDLHPVSKARPKKVSKVDFGERMKGRTNWERGEAVRGSAWYISVKEREVVHPRAARMSAGCISMKREEDVQTEGGARRRAVQYISVQG